MGFLELWVLYALFGLAELFPELCSAPHSRQTGCSLTLRSSADLQVSHVSPDLFLTISGGTLQFFLPDSAHSGAVSLALTLLLMATAAFPLQPKSLQEIPSPSLREQVKWKRETAILQVINCRVK